MKKILAYLLIVVLVFTMFSGCKKKDDTEDLDLEQALEENGGEVVEGNNESDSETDTEEVVDDVEYILYLKYKNEPFLYDDLFSVNINDEKFKDKSIEEFVLQELINYEGKGNYVSPVPEGTKVLSVEREDDNVILNLSKEFKEKKMSSSDARLAIGGIVNSIIALPGNETVEIKVEGEVLKNFNGIDTSKPFHFLEGLIPSK
ncbi:GerMN domain-containing protein [Maledivibacter halophilus]|uniref:Sporulation and spore germination n=1 Tax=Maledivibacter halophilus TaxID=36842 RepID=A0A1T5IWR9_9FIRM|nr:GerMN domain-containing protein [Maledivibacter halophilus]SKC43636.1 Sporulation and spore germination [Maledivibacter halophilus]